MRRVRMLRSTNVGGQGAEPGEVLPLPDAQALTLVRLGKAQYVDAQGQPVPTPADPGILTSDALQPFLDPKAAAQLEDEEERDAPPVEHVAPVVETRDPRPRRRGR